MRALTILVALLIGLIGGSPAYAQRLLHQERSLYRNIFVTKSGDELCMLFRYPVPLGRESCKLMSEPDKLIFDYTQMMMAGLYLNPKPAKILIIGEGGGIDPDRAAGDVPRHADRCRRDRCRGRSRRQALLRFQARTEDARLHRRRPRLRERACGRRIRNTT